MPRTTGYFGGDKFAKKYPEVQNLIAAINSIPLPLVPGYAKYSGHTVFWNEAIDIKADALGWHLQPKVDISPKPKAKWTGDHYMQMPDGLRVFCEIEYGNSASLFRDFAKFDLASKLETYDFFLLGVPGPNAKREIGYATSFDHIFNNREYMKHFVNSPCCVFEIEPASHVDLIKGSTMTLNDINDRMSQEQAHDLIDNHNLKPLLNLP